MPPRDRKSNEDLMPVGPLLQTVIEQQIKQTEAATASATLLETTCSGVSEMFDRMQDVMCQLSNKCKDCPFAKVAADNMQVKVEAQVKANAPESWEDLGKRGVGAVINCIVAVVRSITYNPLLCGIAICLLLGALLLVCGQGWVDKGIDPSKTVAGLAGQKFPGLGLPSGAGGHTGAAGNTGGR